MESTSTEFHIHNSCSPYPNPTVQSKSCRNLSNRTDHPLVFRHVQTFADVYTDACRKVYSYKHRVHRPVQGRLHEVPWTVRFVATTVAVPDQFRG